MQIPQRQVLQQHGKSGFLHRRVHMCPPPRPKSIWPMAKQKRKRFIYLQQPTKVYILEWRVKSETSLSYNGRNSDKK